MTTYFGVSLYFIQGLIRYFAKIQIHTSKGKRAINMEMYVLFINWKNEKSFSMDPKCFLPNTYSELFRISVSALHQSTYCLRTSDVSHCPSTAMPPHNGWRGAWWGYSPAEQNEKHRCGQTRIILLQILQQNLYLCFSRHMAAELGRSEKFWLGLSRV